MRCRPLSVLALILSLIGSAWAVPVQWIGNTKLWYGGQSFPFRGGYIESWQTLTITTETYPIGTGQRVVAVVTTDNFQTTQEYEFSFDFNQGNNTHWYRILGPFPKGAQVNYYLRAEGTGGSPQYDNNGFQNFGFLSRWASPPKTGAILQWFETDYRAIMKRLPEVVMMGYEAIYLPAPNKGGGGGFSVGYNPFDRFDLGDRLQKGTVRTKYGTTQDLIELIRVAKRLGIEVYCDLILNHNDNRASSAINSYPDAIPEDFHIRSSTDTGNSEINFNNESSFSFGMLNHDLVGLVDIAHEDGNYTQTGTFTLPAYAAWNGWGKPSFVRNALNPHYYPGSWTPAAEDMRQLLRRNMSWLAGVIGFQGFRLDAVKHMQPPALGWAPNQAASGSFSGGNYLPHTFAAFPNLSIFGEDYTSNGYELKEYAKTGTNLLDFPLVFKLRDIFNSNGFGHLSDALANGWGVDGSTGLAYQNGGLSSEVGISFVQSHDDGPPTSNNLAHAFILTRPGRAKVYYDGNNIQPGNWANFPRPGRADALDLDGLLTGPMDARKRFARGSLVNRHISGDLFVYERQVNGNGLLLVALNDRGDQSSQTVTVDTAFRPGAILEDLSGQMPEVVVQGNGKATITVPSNYSATSANNGTGYVLYAEKSPKPLQDTDPITLLDGLAASEKLAKKQTKLQIANPFGAYGSAQNYEAWEVKSDFVTVRIRTDATATSAALKLDEGLAAAGRVPMSNTPEGLLNGYVALDKRGNGDFELKDIDLSGLPDGLHVIRVRAFIDNPGRPGVFSEFATFIWLSRSRGRTLPIDGLLTDMGAAATTQQRNSSSNSNRLDAMYLQNDDQFLYVGVAGRIDQSEGLTNGAMLYVDLDPGAGTGIQNFASLNDDSGPAPRLLSNPRITAPTGFGAEYGAAVFRGSWLHSAPETSFTGGAVPPPLVGAFAGLYRLDGQPTSWLAGRAATIAYQQRTNKGDPARGVEIALPLAEFFPNGVQAGKQIGLIAALGTTGESGTTLPSSDPNRAALGGRPAPNSWVSGQFLPTQPNVFVDPGTSPVTLQAYLSYGIAFAQTLSPAQVQLSPGKLGLNGRNGRKNQFVTIKNISAQTIPGPLSLVVHVPGGVQLINRSALTLNAPQRPYIVLPNQSLPPGSSVVLELDYSGSLSGSPAMTIKAGRGVL